MRSGAAESTVAFQQQLVIFLFVKITPALWIDAHVWHLHCPTSKVIQSAVYANYVLGHGGSYALVKRISVFSFLQVIFHKKASQNKQSIISGHYI